MTEQRVALIIGAGSGIGAATARLLAERDHAVAVMSSSGRGEALGRELGGFGFTGSNLVPSELETFVTAAHERFGRIDTLVNCTGHGPKGPVLEMSDDDWHAGMDVYLLSVIRAARLVAPHMTTGGGGAIVNISTFAAFEPEPDFPTSAVFRAALATFTKLFSTEYAARNVRMNNVLPGFVDSLPEKPDRLARIPMERYARAAELAEVVCFLASSASSYITGQNLRVDGGLTRSV